MTSISAWFFSAQIESLFSVIRNSKSAIIRPVKKTAGLNCLWHLLPDIIVDLSNQPDIMSNFEISNRGSSDVVILDIHGELDAHTAPRLEEKLQKLIDEKSVHIVVNGSGLEYISSAGLGVFMAYIEDIREKGGDIKITNLKPKVFNVFDLLGFPTLYDILETEEEALKRF